MSIYICTFVREERNQREGGDREWTAKWPLTAGPQAVIVFLPAVTKGMTTAASPPAELPS